MYSRAASAFRKSLGLFGGFAIIFMMVDVLLPAPFYWPLTALLAGGLAFLCHRMILLGEVHTWTGMFNLSSEPKVGPGPFLLRYIALAISFAGLALLVERAMASAHSDLRSISLMLLILPYGLVLAWIGTVLPATTVGADASLSTAVRRARPTRGRTLLRLILGPLLFGAIAAVLGAMAENVILQLALSGGLGGPGLTIGIRSLQFCMSLATCFVTLLTATALSLAYLETDATEP